MHSLFCTDLLFHSFSQFFQPISSSIDSSRPDSYLSIFSFLLCVLPKSCLAFRSSLPQTILILSSLLLYTPLLYLVTYMRACTTNSGTFCMTSACREHSTFFVPHPRPIALPSGPPYSSLPPPPLLRFRFASSPTLLGTLPDCPLHGGFGIFVHPCTTFTERKDLRIDVTASRANDIGGGLSIDLASSVALAGATRPRHAAKVLVQLVRVRRAQGGDHTAHADDLANFDHLTVDAALCMAQKLRHPMRSAEVSHPFRKRCSGRSRRREEQTRPAVQRDLYCGHEALDARDLLLTEVPATVV